jgi:hypothetical protein
LAVVSEPNHPIFAADGPVRRSVIGAESDVLRGRFGEREYVRTAAVYYHVEQLEVSPANMMYLIIILAKGSIIQYLKLTDE